MAKIYLLIALTGTFIVAGILMTVYYINKCFKNIFHLITDIQTDIKDAHNEVKKLKDSSKD